MSDDQVVRRLGGLLQRLAAIVGALLLHVGLWLEERAEPGAGWLDPDDESCPRCRGNVVTTPGELAGLVGRAAAGVDVTVLLLEANCLHRTEGDG